MSVNTQSHYRGKDSLYKFAEEWQINSYEFDIIKRIVRCRHKGCFQEDLKKTIDLINIYLAEQKAAHDDIITSEYLLDLQK
jgi:hypothetical protein